jgi:capsular exopolysaccharide synthesis family protein
MQNSQLNLSTGNESGDLKKVLSVLGKQKALSFLIIALFFIGGLTYAYFTQPTYETYSTIEVSNDNLDLSLDAVVRGGGISDEATLIDTEVEIIKSRHLIEKALENVGYNIRYFTTSGYKEVELYKNSPIEITELKVKDPLFYNTKFVIEPINDTTYKIYTDSGGVLKSIKKTLGSLLGKKQRELKYSGQHEFNERVDNNYFSLVVKKVAPLENSRYSFISLDKDKAINDVSDRLSVFSLSKNGSIIKMIYQDNSAARAKDFLDNLVNIYLEQSIEKKTSQASSALTFVDQQLQEVSKKLQSSAVKLENFKEENNLVDIQTESQTTLTSLSNFKNQLSDIQIQESAFNALYDEFKTGNYGAVSSLSLQYPVLGTLLDDLQKAKSEKIKLLSVYTDLHPDIAQIDEKINDTKMALESAIESISDSIREKKRSLEDTLYNSETKLLKFPEKERELADLQRKYKINEKTYEFLLQKQAEMSINKASTVSSNRVLDRAVKKSLPVKPNIPMIAVSSLILGFIVAMLVAFLRDFMDHKIKTREELSSATKIPFYGVVPHVRTSEKMFTIDDQQSVASEALRLIRTNLEFIATENKSKVIVVTSTVPNEGKTTIATNLAAVFGMGDKKCIVLSLDMRRPMLHRVFSLTNKIGMSTVLSKKSELKEVIWEHKKIKNLDIITSGPIPPNPSELMQVGKIEELISELRKEYDYIIIDSPPMGLVTDALLLMKQADISLVVFRSEFSEKDYVKTLEDMIASYKIKNVGLVLNDVKPKNMSQSFFKYSYTYK